MVKRSSLRRLSLVSSLAILPLGAQELVTNLPVPDAATLRSAFDGDISNRRNARAITLKIPAPRGQIVARDGEPFAQNRVAYQVALQYRQFENADREFVLNWAHARLTALSALVKNPIPKTDDELYSHYQERRWLPLAVSGQLSQKEAQNLESKLTAGLVLQPVYSRYYPQDEIAAHIIGYSGSVGKLPTGPINSNEPLWEESEGRAGLEKLFDTQLTGEPGMKRLLFDENGNKLLEEQVKRPRPGGTVVTTLDMKWQKLAEKTLREGCRRGAFVVIDVITGEVLVMASRPSFDLNLWVPGISDTDLKALNEDPSTPLVGRAFQSGYPPASSFKPIIALTALEKGTVTENSTIYCPAALEIGNTVMKNWSKTPEGSINVKRALARSCNTWFYQVGIDVGPRDFLDLARRFGFGERTGLPLMSETPGLVPNDEWSLKYQKRRILNGDTANLAIGQGPLLASPLQVAQAMAGIANGSVLPKLQMIRQVQDTRGRVVSASLPDRKRLLGLKSSTVEIVHQGMNDVVNGPGGTGHNAQLSYTTLCGKTGTAQWVISKDQRLAWFAGFLPADNPRYSFAVLYEGRPGEVVSGGKMAAPMVKKFFEGIKDDIKDIIEPPKKALIVVEESAAPPEKALPVPSDPDGEVPPVPSIPEKGTLKAVPVNPKPTAPVHAEPVDDDVYDPSVEPDIRPEQSRAIRAIPVGEDEVIQDGVEEP